MSRGPSAPEGSPPVQRPATSVPDAPGGAGGQVPDAPGGAGAPVVDLYVIGRTLRGSAGRAFVARVVGLLESADERADEGGSTGGPVFTDIGRTVELTAVAVTRVAPVSLEVSIADPMFGGAPHRSAREPSGGAPASGRARHVEVDDLDGIEPLAGPPHLDLRRSVVVTVDSDTAVDVVVHVLQP